MGRFSVMATAAVAMLPGLMASPAGLHGGSGCSSLTAREVRGMGNNTLFARWRPYSHITAPAGWMNDPCAPLYDPTRDEYHVFYQWHPHHFNWGNISWGHATSKDLVTFVDHGSWRGDEALALGPTGNGSFPEHYNGLGIFSGTGQAVNLQGEEDGTLLLMYTSVARLPISWTAPYLPNSESQSLVSSTDGGLTWQEYAGNPVISTTALEPPMNWNVTGFRDPFFEPSPELDEILGVEEPHFYAVFGSGIKGVGPRMPLWTARRADLTEWKFLGALWDPEANSSFGPPLSTHTNAYNFEVSGLFSLEDSDGVPRWFVNMGTEGGNLTFAQSMHSALWNEGTMTRRDNGSAHFTPIAAGLGDWGLAYALTSFNDTKHNRRVQLGWAPEDITGDAGLFSVPEQGSQGSLTLLRELFIHETDHIVDPSGSLADSTNAVLTPSKQNPETFHARTLGVRPLPDVVEGLREGSKSCGHVAKPKTFTATTLLSSNKKPSYEISASLSTSTGGAGLIIAAAADMSEYTLVSYESSNHTLLVVREHSSLLKEQVNTATVTGYFEPYLLQNHETGKEEREEVVMDVFVDGSLVEVYLNERFALATRVYPANDCSTAYGVYIESNTTATFDRVEAWEGLKHVFPERPADSSSELVWDSAEETDGYVWWTGN